MSDRETKIESACRAHAKTLGGRLVKWVSPGRWGVQDDILLLPQLAPLVVFVEFKRPGEKLRNRQRLWRAWMRGSGFTTWEVYSLEQFKEAIAACSRETS